MCKYWSPKIIQENTTENVRVKSRGVKLFAQANNGYIIFFRFHCISETSFALELGRVAFSLQKIVLTEQLK